MRFRFCGDVDAPDWLLADIDLLSNISSQERMHALSVEVIDQLLGRSVVDFDAVETHTTDAGYSVSDVKAAVAAIRFIVCNAVKYDVEESVLKSELQQLGLPKEHTDSLNAPFREHRRELHAKFSEDSFRITQLRGVEWRVDLVLGSSSTPALNTPSVSVRFDVLRPEEGMVKPVAFEVSVDKFQVLLAELQAARAMMGELEGE